MKATAFLALLMIILGACSRQSAQFLQWVAPTKEVIPKVSELKVSECMGLGGSIVEDNGCPQTTSGLYAGGAKVATLSGKWRCRGKGQTGRQGVCIDENEP